MQPHDVTAQASKFHQLVQEDADSDINEEVPPDRVLTTKTSSDCLSEVPHSLEFLSENDPDLERSCAVKRNVLNALKCYSEMLRDKMQQSTLDSFLPTRKDWRTYVFLICNCYPVVLLKFSTLIIHKGYFEFYFLFSIKICFQCEKCLFLLF
jgi:hypothetical protein